MKKTLIKIVWIVAGVIIGWIACYYTKRAALYDLFRPGFVEWVNEMQQDPEIRNITPDDLKKIWSDAAKVAEADVEPNEELILGMAHMAQRHMDIEAEDGIEAANSNRVRVIKSLFNLYPDKNWGELQDVADQIQSTVDGNPELFK